MKVVRFRRCFFLGCSSSDGFPSPPSPAGSSGLALPGQYGSAGGDRRGERQGGRLRALPGAWDTRPPPAALTLEAALVLSRRRLRGSLREAVPRPPLVRRLLGAAGAAVGLEGAQEAVILGEPQDGLDAVQPRRVPPGAARRRSRQRESALGHGERGAGRVHGAAGPGRRGRLWHGTARRGGLPSSGRGRSAEGRWATGKARPRAAPARRGEAGHPQGPAGGARRPPAPAEPPRPAGSGRPRAMPSGARGAGRGGPQLPMGLAPAGQPDATRGCGLGAGRAPSETVVGRRTAGTGPGRVLRDGAAL